MTFNELVEKASYYGGGIEIEVEEVKQAVKNIAPIFLDKGTEKDREKPQYHEYCFAWYKGEEPSKWLYEEESETLYRECPCVVFDINYDEYSNVVIVYYICGIELVEDPKRVTPRDLIHDIDLGDWYEYKPRKK